MTPDEVVKVLERIQKWHEDGVSSESKRRPEWLYQDAALTCAISLIQDYQKLRERVSVEKIRDYLDQWGYRSGNMIKLTDDEWLKVAQAIVTYLQQPTGPRER